MRKLLVVTLALAGACSDQGSTPGHGPRIDRGYVQANLLDAPPASLPNRVDAVFRDGTGEVRYLGNDLAMTAVAPGDKVTLTHYWQVVTPPAGHWKIFSHLLGGAGDFTNVDATDMRTGHRVSEWKAGQVIRDEQSFVVERDWKSPTARLIVGFFQPGKHRIADRMEVDAPGAADRAVVVATLTIDLEKAPPPAGTVILRKAEGPITIDGVADEPGWRAAAVQTDFASAEGCPELDEKTSAKMTWDDQFLYVFVEVDDADVWSPFTQHDDHLWEADVVEVFIDADGNGRGYVELQVNPRNAQFDTWFAVGRPNRDDSFSAGMQTQVTVKGTLDDRDDGDSGWDVEIAIPHAAVKGKDAAMKVAVPPRPGDRWRLNVVRVDKNREEKVRAAAWSRIACADFHGLDRMLTVQFADATGSTRPAELEAPEGDAGPAEAPDAGAGATPPRMQPRVQPRPVAPRGDAR